MKYLLAAIAVAALASPALANPHPNPFSYPYETLPAGKLEIEQYLDLVPVRVELEHPDGTIDGVTSLRSVHVTELEYGLTDRLEFGWYFQFRQGATADTPFLRFDGVKQRLRYRFAEAGTFPIDIGVYLELAEFHNELEFEEKLLLRKRLGEINLVANLWVEQEWYFQTKDTKFIFNPTVGASYEINPKVIVGAEYWARGRFDKVVPDDANNSDAPMATHHYLGPTLLLQQTNVFLSLGVYARLDGIGKTAVVNDQYGKLWVRAIVGVEL
ncbi:MAG: hypothetical protein HOV81_16370 [Kofleriaceae bacterium]|nr:hypothetical protein [Kofleriaceae bacterium]